MRQAEEPLTRISVHIFTSDYEYLTKHGGWSVEVRYAIRAYITDQKRKAASVSEGIVVHQQVTGD